MRSLLCALPFALVSYAPAGPTMFMLDSGVNRPGVARGPDFTGGDGIDCHGHGTALAGISGVPTANIVSVRILGCDGTGRHHQILDALRWVRSKAVQGDFVLLAASHGPTPQHLLLDWDTEILASVDKGVTWITGDGNRNAWAVNYTPSRIDKIIVVAAADGLVRRPTSSYGQQIDFFEDACANGWCGSSVSAAIAAGDVFKLLTLYPWAPPAHISNLLTESCAAVMKDPGPGTTSCKR